MTERSNGWLGTLVVAFALVAASLPQAAAGETSDPWDRVWELVPSDLPGTCEPLSHAAGDTVVPSVAALACLEYDGPDKVEDVGFYLFEDLEQLRQYWTTRTTPATDGTTRASSPRTTRRRAATP